MGAGLALCGEACASTCVSTCVYLLSFCLVTNTQQTSHMYTDTHSLYYLSLSHPSVSHSFTHHQGKVLCAEASSLSPDKLGEVKPLLGKAASAYRCGLCDCVIK